MKLHSRVFILSQTFLLLTMSTSAFSSNGNTSNQKPPSTSTSINAETNDDADKVDTGETPALPMSDPDNKDIPVLQFGEKMSFDHLGPIIINLDGSTRRIDNWAELTEKEQEVSWRRIAKRNEERRKALLEKQLQEGKQKEESN